MIPLCLLLIVSITGYSKEKPNKEYYQINVDNPEYKPNVSFHFLEDLTSPRFSYLIEKYQLDTIFHGETDEFERILLLRHWIKSVIKIDNEQKDSTGRYNPEYIIDMAMSGTGFHCAHFRIVQNAIMNAFGYVTRTMGAGPGIQGGPDGHHGINEIWLNKYHKWFLSDAKYDWHFEKNGIPLCALEIRDEYLKNEAADILKVKGPERILIDVDPSTGSFACTAQSAQTYTWIEWDAWNDMQTYWPDHKYLLYVYEDDYAKNHTWIWGGKPHWAYNTEFMKMIPDRDVIEWTPNTIASTVTIEGNKATIELKSDTPNFEEYQMKDLVSGNAWQKVDDKFEFELTGERHQLVFRTVNIAGVSGPEHTVIIQGQP